MYWFHADKDTYRQLLDDQGFKVPWERFFPQGDGGHTLIMGQTERTTPMERSAIRDATYEETFLLTDLIRQSFRNVAMRFGLIPEF